MQNLNAHHTVQIICYRAFQTRYFLMPLSPAHDYWKDAHTDSMPRHRLYRCYMCNTKTQRVLKFRCPIMNLELSKSIRSPSLWRTSWLYRGINAFFGVFWIQHEADSHLAHFKQRLLIPWRSVISSRLWREGCATTELVLFTSCDVDAGTVKQYTHTNICTVISSFGKSNAAKSNNREGVDQHG